MRRKIIGGRSMVRNCLDSLLAPTKSCFRARYLAITFVVVALLAGDAAARPARATVEPSLTLDRAIELVLKNNAELKASSFEVRAAFVSHTYAGRLKNPALNVVIEDFLGNPPLSGFSSAQTTVSLSQTLELAGQRGARTEVASAALSAARAEHESRRVRLLAETVVRFLHVVADQHRLAIDTRARVLATQGLLFATRRVKSGAASTVEQRRANIALARSKLAAEHARHELRASKRRLSVMWGDSEARFGEAEAELFAPHGVLTYDALAARIEKNPELVRLAKEQAVQRAKLALARSEAVPDLTLSVGGRRAEGPDAFSFLVGLSVPIPLFERNQGAIGVAKWQHSELVAAHEAERLRLLAGLYGFTQELGHAAEQLETLHREIVPEAKSVLELVTSGFKVGRFSQIELLDAQRTLVELERERVGAAEEVWTLRVRINHILGATHETARSPSRESHRGDNDD